MANANRVGFSPVPFISGGAITANSMVELDTTEGQVIASTAIADLPIGVALTGATAAGQQVMVQMYGVAKCRIGATLNTIGAALMVKASGTGELNAAAGATAVTVARLMETGVSGDTVNVYLLGPRGKHPAFGA